MAFQNPTLMPWRTTMDKLLLPMEIVAPHKRRFRRHRAEYEAQAMALLRTVGLATLPEISLASSPAACSSVPTSAAP